VDRDERLARCRALLAESDGLRGELERAWGAVTAAHLRVDRTSFWHTQGSYLQTLIGELRTAVEKAEALAAKLPKDS